VPYAPVLKYFVAGGKSKVLFYGVASVSGQRAAVCSCAVLPLFASIYTRAAGIVPVTAFLYSGPVINVLAIILTSRVLSPPLGIARAVGATVFSIVLQGLLGSGVDQGPALAVLLAGTSPTNSPSVNSCKKVQKDAGQTDSSLLFTEKRGDHGHLPGQRRHVLPETGSGLPDGGRLPAQRRRQFGPRGLPPGTGSGSDCLPRPTIPGPAF
jgi:hypothetical protein